MFCMYFSAHHARIGRGAGLGFSCKWHLQQRKLCQRQAITATGIQRENASLQRQGVEQFKKNLVIPTQLMGKEHQIPTVYTVRLTTGFTRGSGLNEPLAGVHLCLVGETGQAVLHWVSPIFDPAKLQDELDAINKVMDTTVGANRKAIAQGTARIVLLPAGKPRFQPGGVDEVSFLGPEIGFIQSLMVSPEAGNWRLEEATVSSSRSKNTSRFVCGEMLGVEGGAGFLAAVPSEAVVYGSGESLVVLTRSQAHALHEAGMDKYSMFKQRAIEANLSLVSIGTGLVWTFAGDYTALEFALGGAGGLVYNALLQKGADAVAFSDSHLYRKAKGYGLDNNAVTSMVASGFFRIGMVAVLMACIIYGTRIQDPALTSHSHPSQVQQLAAGCAGFLMYKVAVVGVLTVPALFQLRQPQSEN